MYGVVDSGAEITIIGGDTFKRVASVAKLKSTPHNYDQQPFHIDGRMTLPFLIRQ